MTGSSEPRAHRRADIQGLRAVAVVGVIAAHLSGVPRGGWLGVDVFFVISGFVITGVLLRERDRTGRTSLTGFYARRARRILPAALVVLVVTVVAARWAYAPARADEVRTDALWAALFAANWHFAAQGADYFQLGQVPSPVQHFWSLGVEEQFYLVWPWLVVAAAGVLGSRTARRGRLGVATAAALVVVASLGWAAWRADADPTVAYFSSLTRAWELALGALLALVPAYAVRLPRIARWALAWGGLAGIAAAFVLTGPSVASPVPAAVWPVLATMAVLLAGTGTTGAGPWPLTNPVSRYVGDISYGLYLWHFPLIVFATSLYAPLTPLAQAAIVAATVLLAVISHHLLERPVLDAPRLTAWSDPTERHTAWGGWWRTQRRAMVAAATALACVAGGVAVTAFAEPGAFEPTAAPVAAAANGAVPAPDVSTPSAKPSALPSATTTSAAPTPTPTASAGPVEIPLGRTGAAIQAGLRGALASSSWPSVLHPAPDAWQTVGAPGMGACVATRASDPESCTFGNPKGPEIIVYGDSLGIPLLSTVIAAYGKTYKIRGMTKLACAVNGVDADFGKDDWAIPCVRHREMTIDYVRTARPRVLIMIENYAWSLKLKSGASGTAAAAEWHAADQAFVDAVKGSVGHVVILGPSMPGVAFLDCYRPGGSPRRCVTGIPKWWKVANDAERDVEGATFVDTLHWYCVDGRCPLFTRAGNIVLKGDYLHPTVQYARALAPDLAYRLAYAGVLPR
ncbi:acyltransferase [Intrasporangium oryzae NRRL B-24470]|uniref:Acyltransferase n=1 Tax=Intrasporangium oryzae NRRL B-24470 TaxID=1386089 RepID=W9G9E8_9MICO|nr:acyltransferase family protein [Intrasporangium oryzae]EWT02821.1 acyltransferase [Intrasporangium oryzae NRRL B-24470]